MNRTATYTAPLDVELSPEQAEDVLERWATSFTALHPAGGTVGDGEISLRVVYTPPFKEAWDSLAELSLLLALMQVLEKAGRMGEVPNVRVSRVMGGE